jgi:hypothetical protein
MKVSLGSCKATIGQILGAVGSFHFGRFSITHPFFVA